MIKVHLYLLTVRWTGCKSWVIYILSKNASCCIMWLDKTEKDDNHITNVDLALIKRNVSEEKDSFVAMVSPEEVKRYTEPVPMEGSGFGDKPYISESTKGY